MIWFISHRRTFFIPYYIVSVMETHRKSLCSKILSALVFVILMSSSLLAGHHGYCTERDNITADLNNALTLTLNDRSADLITPDTIKAYRYMQSNSDGKVLFAVADRRFCSYIKNENLKRNAYITFDIIDDNCEKGKTFQKTLCSDTVILDKEYCGETIALRSYSTLSAAAVFQLSDQRLSSMLFLMAVAWAFVSTMYLHRKHEDAENQLSYGGLVLSSFDDRFYTEDNTPVHFTPMQEQLMKMFIASPSHTLSKEEICSALWPKKDDASDTLYTLIRRIKPIIESNTNLSIVSDRSKGYILKIR